ncbi:MAG TPA: ArsR family transcriptional regulator [Hellea balneolensis]|uniref:ArsR family transcriptional regulator n=1 Tax=Hellea balneolensis TaxID=287478 RepID=A0A7C3C2Z8_9PROT|nr:ArsR family transcriptional regulator [Hellea balneolensis]
MPTQDVFRALADPTRRAIITMLADEPMNINQISNQFEISRPAIAKHLKILEKGNIIRVQKTGRDRINTLQPQALKSVADWLAHYSRFWDTKLSTLKHAVEHAKED